MIDGGERSKAGKVIKRFSSRQFRSSSSITSALLLMDLGGVRRKMARKNCERINAVKTVTFFSTLV